MAFPNCDKCGRYLEDQFPVVCWYCLGIARPTGVVIKAISFALSEALRCGTHWVAPEHLVLGLLSADWSLMSKFVRSNVSTDKLKRAVEAILARKSEVARTARSLPHETVVTPSVQREYLSAESERVFEYAAREANALSRQAIGTVHLLLGLLSDKESAVSRSLRKLGFDAPTIRDSERGLEPLEIIGSTFLGQRLRALSARFGLESLARRLDTWRTGRLQRRLERLTSRAAHLDENVEYDLFELYSKGFVFASASGNSITSIHAEIENLVAKSLWVVIKPGTYFVARGSCQNMVTRRQASVRLEPTSTNKIWIDATCINAGRPIPSTNDRFRGVRRVSKNLSRFLNASVSADPMTVQAGVWAVTDNYTSSDVKTRLVARDRRGIVTGAAVTDRNIEEARHLLKELGIRNRL